MGTAEIAGRLVIRYRKRLEH